MTRLILQNVKFANIDAIVRGKEVKGRDNIC